MQPAYGGAEFRAVAAVHAGPVLGLLVQRPQGHCGVSRFLGLAHGVLGGEFAALPRLVQRLGAGEPPQIGGLAGVLPHAAPQPGQGLDGIAAVVEVAALELGDVLVDGAPDQAEWRAAEHGSGHRSRRAGGHWWTLSVAGPGWGFVVGCR